LTPLAKVPADKCDGGNHSNRADNDEENTPHAEDFEYCEGRPRTVATRDLASP
jgi:hypothetical protein